MESNEIPEPKFDRSGWNDQILVRMLTSPRPTPAELAVADPESLGNLRRRRALTKRIVERRVLAGYLLEEATDLESTLTELGGPSGKIADIIHTTKKLSTKDVEKRSRKFIPARYHTEQRQTPSLFENIKKELDFFTSPGVLGLVGMAAVMWVSYIILAIMVR